MMILSILVITILTSLKTVTFGFSSYMLLIVLNILELIAVNFGVLNLPNWGTIFNCIQLGIIKRGNEYPVFKIIGTGQPITILIIPVLFSILFVYVLAGVGIDACKKKVDIYSIPERVIQFTLIHYVWTTIIALDTVVNIDKNRFFSVFVMLFYITFITFIIPAVLFYIIYERKAIFYRKRYNWLVFYQNKTYKFFIFYLFLEKVMCLFVWLLSNYSVIASTSIMLLWNIISFVFHLYLRPFRHKMWNYFYVSLRGILLLCSLFCLISSIVELDPIINIVINILVTIITLIVLTVILFYKMPKFIIKRRASLGDIELGKTTSEPIANWVIQAYKKSITHIGNLTSDENPLANDDSLQYEESALQQVLEESKVTEEPNVTEETAVTKVIEETDVTKFIEEELSVDGCDITEGIDIEDI